MFKKVDQLVLSSFIGPFVLTFFITMFVLVMQFLWKYIDDLIGKGLELNILLQLLFYASASMVPMAAPLAVLLSSIMTFGNMGEHYELVAFKSSGISLWRTMRAQMLACAIIALGTFWFANTMLPKANLKFGALLYSIRQQKPALNIKERVFYNGIDGYSIRVGKKDEDDRTIYNVMIYDHTSGRGNDNVLVAEKGEMFTTDDGLLLHLKLYNGSQYQEMTSKKGKEDPQEQLRTYFKEWEKIFDLSSFQLDKADENFFKDHYQMLNLAELQRAMDTLEMAKASRQKMLRGYLEPVFHFVRADMDTLAPFLTSVTDLNDYEKKIRERSDSTRLKKFLTPYFYFLKAKFDPSPENEQYTVKLDGVPHDQLPSKEKKALMKKALTKARNVKNYTKVVERDIETKEYYLIRHKIEWHRKFTVSLGCLVLFFIGAPLGAIIRKGGLGTPLVVSVVFFVIYYVISITGEKFAKEGMISVFWGMWISTFILLPLGFFLTFKAMNDSSLFNIDAYRISVLRLFKRFSGKKNA